MDKILQHDLVRTLHETWLNSEPTRASRARLAKMKQNIVDRLSSHASSLTPEECKNFACQLKVLDQADKQIYDTEYVVEVSAGR